MFLRVVGIIATTFNAATTGLHGERLTKEKTAFDRVYNFDKKGSCMSLSSTRKKSKGEDSSKEHLIVAFALRNASALHRKANHNTAIGNSEFTAPSWQFAAAPAGKSQQPGGLACWLWFISQSALRFLSCALVQAAKSPPLCLHFVEVLGGSPCPRPSKTKSWRD